MPHVLDADADADADRASPVIDSARHGAPYNLDATHARAILEDKPEIVMQYRSLTTDADTARWTAEVERYIETLVPNIPTAMSLHGGPALAHQLVPGAPEPSVTRDTILRVSHMLAERYGTAIYGDRDTLIFAPAPAPAPAETGDADTEVPPLEEVD